MKQLVTNYSFNVTAKTVTLPDFSNGVSIGKLLLIFDVNVGVLLHEFDVTSTTTKSSNVFTLASVPTGATSADTLLIYYDCGIGDPTYDPIGRAAANIVGTWGYVAGASGSPTIPAGAKILSISAHATTSGSFTINSGNSVPVPANVGANLTPMGNLVAPSITFTGTDSYFVEYVV